MIALLDASTSLHGYEVMQMTGIKPGTLYPMLARLEDQGMLVSQWQESAIAGRPPRHMYSLTEAGQAMANSLVRDGRGSEQPELRTKSI